MTAPIHERLAAELDALDQRALRRRRRSADGAGGPDMIFDGRPVLAFASNDYLGLAGDARLAAAAAQGAQRWGVGAGASHLVSGHYRVHDRLEACLAEHVGCEAALYFGTGYLANMGVLPALVGRGDAIFADKLNHASLVDGALLSRAELHRYPHGDLAALERALQASAARRKLIATDSVFSMDGDLAALPALLALAERFDAWLVVDDAHGFGVLGRHGGGALRHWGLASPRLAYVGTLGKAAGVSGAFVAGSRTLVEWLANTARTYLFTTGAPPLLAHTLLTAVELIAQGEERRAHLRALIARLRAGLRLTRWQLLPSDTPIQPIRIGDNAATLAAAHALFEEGLWVPAIRPPTVPAGQARLRISLSAAHGMEQVDRLADCINRLDRA
jgi:8-amino-7-oxononanoate synthase